MFIIINCVKISKKSDMINVRSVFTIQNVICFVRSRSFLDYYTSLHLMPSFLLNFRIFNLNKYVTFWGILFIFNVQQH